VTFKDNCPDVRNSKVVDLITELRDWNAEVVAFDCWADREEVREEYGLELVDLDGPWDADAIVVAVGHDQYKSLDLASLRTHCRSPSPVLADLKAIYSMADARAAGFTVFRL
jgi:UDP-N-acetyl-D-galactosamine dehydrogenase